MTRINANIPPKFLSDHHLIAETKEIRRLPMLFRTRMNNNTFTDDLPHHFTLGEGHLLFFMNKGKWAWERSNALRIECSQRGFTLPPQNVMAWDEFALYDGDGKTFGSNHYQWSNHDRILVINRIIDKMLARLRERENYGVSFKGTRETPETTIKRLLKSII